MLRKMSIVDSLRFADRTYITVDSTIHADFNGFPVYTARASAADIDSFAIAHRSQATAVRASVGITRYVACFLDMQLGREDRGRGDCPSIPRSTTVRVPPFAGPTEEQLYNIMHQYGIERAKQVLASARASGKALGLRQQAMQKIVNELGYMNLSAESDGSAELMNTVFPRKAAN